MRLSHVTLVHFLLGRDKTICAEVAPPSGIPRMHVLARGQTRISLGLHINGVLSLPGVPYTGPQLLGVPYMGPHPPSHSLISCCLTNHRGRKPNQ